MSVRVSGRMMLDIAWQFVKQLADNAFILKFDMSAETREVQPSNIY